MSTIAEKLKELRKQRTAKFDAFKAIAEKQDFKPEDQPEFDRLKKEVDEADLEIKRAQDVQERMGETAQPVAGQEYKAPAAPETDPYIKDKSLVIGGVAKMMGRGGGSVYNARQAATDLYGESHPVTKALLVSVGPSGGFIVPPDYVNAIIELLRPRAQVRGAGPRVIPMPRGTMTLPGQASAASASYGSENAKITKSQQTLNQIVATYKKLTALVPVSNDMMRYADPAVDAFVRDDLVKVMALREDLAFLLGTGLADSPKGYLTFANEYAVDGGGTAGVFDLTGAAACTAASGGNFITTTASFTLATVAQEIGGAINKLDTANVPDTKRVWFMHPRSKNYLLNVQNSLGVYVYRDEVLKGTLLGYPIKTTTQIPINIISPSSANTDTSFVILAEMDESMILDSMQLELAVSREGSYIDENGNTVSAFQQDQTIIRAIQEHDFQLRHRAACAVIQFVRWAPAIS